jgi:pimeloyl-ACP methyl ester carboxylesterase
VKAYYPALAEASDPIGTLAPDTSLAPYPVLLWFTGNNTDPATYSWLAERAAGAGFCVVTFTHLGLIPPDMIGISPGVDLSLARPDTFGSAPMASLLHPLLQLMAELDAGPGPLTGLLDLDSVVIGGHSAGGTVALNSARHAFVPQLRGVISYAAHTMASTMFGWEPGTVLPLTGDVPVLMFAAGRDGLVAKAARWYGEDGDDADPIARTFATLPEGAARSRSRLVRIPGANHFTICHPRGESLPRLRDDLAATVDEAQVRELISAVVLEFLRAAVAGDDAALDRLDTALTASPLTKEAPA